MKNMMMLSLAVAAMVLVNAPVCADDIMVAVPSNTVTVDEMGFTFDPVTLHPVAETVEKIGSGLYLLSVPNTYGIRCDGLDPEITALLKGGKAKMIGARGDSVVGAVVNIKAFVIKTEGERFLWTFTNDLKGKRNYCADDSGAVADSAVTRDIDQLYRDDLRRENSNLIIVSSNMVAYDRRYGYGFITRFYGSLEGAIMDAKVLYMGNGNAVLIEPIEAVKFPRYR